MIQFIVNVSVSLLIAGAAEPQPVRGGYLSWAPTEEAASSLAKAGINTLIYRFNGLYHAAGDDPVSHSIVLLPKKFGAFVRWAELAEEHGMGLWGCVESYDRDEAAFFKGKEFRQVVLANGQEGGVPCPLEPLLWRLWQRQAEVLAELSGVVGVVIDTETYAAGAVYPGYGGKLFNECYCDECFAPFAARKQSGNGVTRERRHGWLKEQDALKDYFNHLEARVVKCAATLAEGVRARRPGAALGLVNFFDNYHARGLARGFASVAPTVVFDEISYSAGLTPDVSRRAAELKAISPNVRYVGGLMLSRWAPRGLCTQGLRLSREADGFWLFCANSLLSNRAGQEKARSVWRLKVLYADRYLAALGRLAQAPVATDLAGVEVRSPNLLPGIKRWPTKPVTNLMQNGGFEEPLTDWKGYYAKPTADDRVKRTGQRSLRLDNGATSWRRPAHVSHRVSLRPGRYRVRYSVKTQDVVCGRGVEVLVLCAKKERHARRLSGTQDWMQREIDFEVPDATSEPIIFFRMHYASGTAWFDDLRVIESPTVTLTSDPWQPPKAGTWNRVRWEADVPEGAQLSANVVDAENREDIWPNVPNGAKISVIGGAIGSRPLRVRFEVEPNERGEYPVLKSATLSALVQ